VCRHRCPAESSLVAAIARSMPRHSTSALASVSGASPPLPSSARWAIASSTPHRSRLAGKRSRSRSLTMAAARASHAAASASWASGPSNTSGSVSAAWEAAALAAAAEPRGALTGANGEVETTRNGSHLRGSDAGDWLAGCGNAPNLGARRWCARDGQGYATLSARNGRVLTGRLPPTSQPQSACCIPPPRRGSTGRCPQTYSRAWRAPSSAPPPRRRREEGRTFA